jgi:hypothetical protein
MHIALDFDDSPKTFLEISRTCNISNPQLVKSFLQKHSFLFHIQGHNEEGDMVLVYSAPFQLRNFFLDPGRSRHLYSVPWIIGKCWEAIECALETRSFRWYTATLWHFFSPSQDCQISGASHMLFAESIRNGLDDVNLLPFLGFLCKIPWVDTWFIDESDDQSESEVCTLAIAQWVCKTLVS